MKKLIVLAFALFTLPAFAGVGDKIFGRFSDPDAPRTVFIPKGNWSMGVSGGYRSFDAGGDTAGSGYSILSLLNIGEGFLRMYSASPGFSYFVADDLSLGLNLDYSGYTVDTNLKLDFRDVVNMDDMDDETKEMMGEVLNFQLSARYMVRNAWGGSMNLRKYISFFGSHTFAVFGEARLYGNYGWVESCPVDRQGVRKENRMRTSHSYSAGLRLCGGLCAKLRDNSAVTISVPIIGAAYQYTRQHKADTNNNAHMSSFNISRDVQLLGIQVGYVHYITPKKR